MKSRLHCIVLLLTTLTSATSTLADMNIPVCGATVLRSGNQVEWAGFANGKSPPHELRSTFQLSENFDEATLVLRQRDVKQRWAVALNGTKIGNLISDENDQTLCFTIPPGTLVLENNTLVIACAASTSDDIVVGPVSLVALEKDDYVRSASVTAVVRDDSTGEPLPCRLTVVNEDGALQCTGAESGDGMAVRAGVIYCRGTASFGLPAGKYSVIASRGPEYSIDRAEIVVSRGSQAEVELELTREVATDGYVACDTHVHTREFSGHGDCTASERVLTLAGEAVELPITTEHNKHSSYVSHAIEQQVRQYFTPVTGNEFTTKVGHFNLFPAQVATPVPDHGFSDWDGLFGRVFATPSVRVCIMNHPEDVHSGFRPFGPEHVLRASARNLDQWRLEANAMEVINSGAQQTDMMLQVADWMRLLNRGLAITPIGSSDSHDVSRYIVGQGRTYIRCDDSDPSAIDVDSAVNSLLAGRVIVSLGLFCEMTIGDAKVGDIVPQADGYAATVRVSGPSWITARRVRIYRNGVVWKTIEIAPHNARRPGTKLAADFMIPDVLHDEHVVAIAEGDPVTALHWPVAKPYQPRSIDWNPKTMSISGAIWIDADGDSRRTSALEYASHLLSDSPTHAVLFKRLENYDRSTAIMVADRLDESGISPLDETMQSALKVAAPDIRDAFHEFASSWRLSQQARAGAAR